MLQDIFHTPPKINVEPENDALEDDYPSPGCILRFHVIFFRVVFHGYSNRLQDANAKHMMDLLSTYSQ